MTNEEKFTKLIEFGKQLETIENSIKNSGIDAELIDDALNSISEARLDLGASRIVIRRLLHNAAQAA